MLKIFTNEKFNMENIFDNNEGLSNNVGELRDELVKFLKKVYSNKKYFMNERRATEKIMTKILEEPQERKNMNAKLNIAMGFVMLVLNFLEKPGFVRFINGGALGLLKYLMGMKILCLF